MTPSEKTEAIKKLTELSNSDGWIILMRIVAAEREAFFRKMAAPTAQLPAETIHYNRGIIEATYRFEELPAKMAEQLKSDLRLQSSQPATAGKI